MAGSDINDTVGRIRDLLLSQSKAGRLRSLLDSVYGATEPVRRIPGMLGQFMGDAAPGGALNPELTPANMRTAAEYAAMTPNPIGDVASLGLAADDLRKGDYGSAALNSVGMLPFVPAMGGVTMYRGIHGKYDPNFKQDIEWFSKEKSLAEEYGPNLVQKDIEPIAPANLGFRTYGTETKFDDVLDRISRAITDRFNSNKLPKDTALKLIDDVESLRGGKDYKKVHQWLMESPQAANLLKGAGYDSIEHVERGVPTYGILK